MNILDKGFSEHRAELTKYALDTFSPEDQVLAQVRVMAEEAGLPPIHVAPMDGLHLEVLTRAAGVKKAVEIGTLAGYSGICISRGLAPGGVLHTFELEEKHQQVARRAFDLAGLSSSVQFHLGPALQNLLKIEKEGPYDLVFIDADKPNYPSYLEWAERNLRVGGVVLGDNTFAFGKIAQTQFLRAGDEETVLALRRFNANLARNPKFRATILPTGEGLTFAVKIRE